MNWNDVTDAQVPSALLVKTALAAKVDNSMVSSQIVNDDSKIFTSKAVYDASKALGLDSKKVLKSLIVHGNKKEDGKYELFCYQACIRRNQ